MSGGETIYALSTVPGRAAIAVVRVSGANAHDAARALTGRELPAPRMLSRRWLTEPEPEPEYGGTGGAIDDAMIVRFDAPASCTGEDLIEFHLHGGLAVCRALLDALSVLPGLRAALPGEFSRRAFDNGRLDLTGAEAVIDLIDAETDSQRRQALRQVSGAARKLCEDWTGRLVGVLAALEAAIDFAEDDLPDSAFRVDRPALTAVRDEIAEHRERAKNGERLRSGVHIAIVGAPNVGKSSLLNALARRDAAIVSEVAGTTRDLIDVHMDIGGHAVILTDTAGLREAGDTADAIERAGVDRAKMAANRADIVLLLRDLSDPASTPGFTVRDAIEVWNKSDLSRPEPAALAVSAKMGAGLAELEVFLGRTIRDRFSVGEGAMMTRARHREALSDCLNAIGRALDGSDLVLVVEDLRAAVRAIGRVTGRVDVEDVLDRIFSSFCIGK